MQRVGVTLVTLLGLAVSGCLAQEWELGVAGGYGYSRDATVNTAAGDGEAGFKHGALVSAVVGNNMYSHVGGELRYVYRLGDLNVRGGGQEASFSGESHLIHYDLLIHAAKKGARVRPFAAVGGGVRVFRGTGTEVSYQPASKYALLTKTQELEGLISVGGGVKIAVSRSVSFRLDFRDYITRFPTGVIAPAPGAKIDGWLHDLASMAGISFTF